ncbi:hypothetical protein AB4Z19_27955 [Pseudoduganella sp. RAF19]|uniref:hypothetical protein n=1 Tax=Pseudoduganella sp. RAF19 TaxID=3233052 RepID=UPI003F9B0727
MFKKIMAGAAILCGIALSISQILQQHWVSAVEYLVAGMLTGTLFLLGDFSSIKRPAFIGGFAVVSGLSLLAVFTEHRAFEAGRAEVLAEGVDIFLTLDPLQCPLPPSRVHYLQGAGVKTCAMQGLSDQLDAAQALQRAHLVSPEMTLADGVLQAPGKKSPDLCVNFLREIQLACPNVLPHDLAAKLTKLSN